MSLTIEFYSAEPEKLIALFAEDLTTSFENSLESEFLQEQELFPRADFPSHLVLPDDLDNLCQIIHAHYPLIPAYFEEVCIQHLWDDGQNTEFLILLSEQFAHALIQYDENSIQQVASAWASTFPYKEHLPTPPAYQAVLQLRNIAYDAVIQRKSLIYHLAGDPGFFEYLRYI